MCKEEERCSLVLKAGLDETLKLPLAFFACLLLMHVINIMRSDEHRAYVVDLFLIMGREILSMDPVLVVESMDVG